MLFRDEVIPSQNKKAFIFHLHSDFNKSANYTVYHFIPFNNRDIKREQFGNCSRFIYRLLINASAQTMPSIAADIMPPAYPAPSPAG